MMPYIVKLRQMAVAEDIFYSCRMAEVELCHHYLEGV
jgi:hypothetical protein